MPPQKPNSAVINPGDPLSTSLVMAIPFLDGIGSTAVDIGPNSLNGSLIGGTSWFDDPTLGVVLQLDGSTGYVQLLSALNTFLNGIGAASVAIWMRLRNNVPSAAAQSGLMNLGGMTGSNAANHWVEPTSAFDSGSALLSVFRSSTRISIPPTVATPLGDDDKTLWHQLVITTQSGGNWIGYLNGVAMTGGSAAEPTVTATLSPTIGRSSDTSGSFFLDGWIGDFRVWSRVLQPNEVGTLYNNPWGLYVPGPPQGQLKSVVSMPELDIFGSFGARAELLVGDVSPTAPYAADGFLVMGDFQPQVVSNATTPGWDPRRKPAFPPPAINSDPITTGLVAALPFDEGTGSTANDHSGNSNNATVSNTGAWTSTSAFLLESGSVAPRYNVNGGDFATITESASLKPAHWSIAAWVYPFASSQPANATILSKRTDGANSSVYSYMIGISPDGTHFTAQMSDVIDSPDETDSNSGIPLNQPVHVAASYDGAFMRLYINGVLDNQVTNSGSTYYPVSVQDIIIGPNGTSAFNGGIEDVRIWNRALTDQEMNDLYRGPFGIYCQRALVASVVSMPELNIFGSDGFRSELMVADVSATAPYSAIGFLFQGDVQPALQNAAGMGFFSVTPSFGPTTGGTSVTIRGFGFFNITTVYIGGTLLQGMTVVDQFTITGTTPAHLQGLVDIQINSTTNSVLTAPTVYAFSGGFGPGSGPRITGKLLDNTLIRQEKFIGQTSTGGVDTSLALTLTDYPIDPLCVEVHVMHIGDQGMLEMVQDTAVNGGTYSVDMANKKIIWHGVSAPFQLVSSDTVVVCYLAQGN